MTHPHPTTEPQHAAHLQMSLEMTLIAVREGEAGLIRWLEERELLRQAYRSRLGRPQARA